MRSISLVTLGSAAFLAAIACIPAVLFAGAGGAAGVIAVTVFGLMIVMPIFLSIDISMWVFGEDTLASHISTIVLIVTSYSLIIYWLIKG